MFQKTIKTSSKKKRRNIFSCPQSYREFSKTKHAKLFQSLNDEKLYYLNGKKLIEQSITPGPGAYNNTFKQNKFNYSLNKVSEMPTFKNYFSNKNSPYKLICSRNTNLDTSLNHSKVRNNLNSLFSGKKQEGKINRYCQQKKNVGNESEKKALNCKEKCKGKNFNKINNNYCISRKDSLKLLHLNNNELFTYNLEAKHH